MNISALVFTLGTTLIVLSFFVPSKKQETQSRSYPVSLEMENVTIDRMINYETELRELPGERPSLRSRISFPEKVIENIDDISMIISLDEKVDFNILVRVPGGKKKLITKGDLVND